MAMTDEARDLGNVRDYLMRAAHGQLGMVAGALAHELLMRGLPGDGELFAAANALRRLTSEPRGAPLVRPPVEGLGLISRRPG